MRPTLDDVVAALATEGCRVAVLAGAATRGAVDRQGRPRPWDFVGQVNHHDALTEQVSDARALALMRTGRPPPNALAGPLTNGWIDSDSTVWIVALGNANHAGYGEADALQRIRTDQPPAGDARSDPDRDSVVGNPHLWGWEVRNAGDGRDPYEQLDAMVRANAALARLGGWTANRSIAHREWTARKPDPAGIDMVAFRRLVAARLDPARPKEAHVFASIVAALKTFYAYPADDGAWTPNQRRDARYWYGVAGENGETNTVNLIAQLGVDAGHLPAA